MDKSLAQCLNLTYHELLSAILHHQANLYPDLCVFMDELVFLDAFLFSLEWTDKVTESTFVFLEFFTLSSATLHGWAEIMSLSKHNRMGNDMYFPECFFPSIDTCIHLVCRRIFWMMKREKLPHCARSRHWNTPWHCTLLLVATLFTLNMVPASSEQTDMLTEDSAACSFAPGTDIVVILDRWVWQLFFCKIHELNFK